MMSHDIESQVVSPSIPARTQRISADSLMDPIDDFFGHALRQQTTRITHTGGPISANSDILPPYYHPSPRCSEYLPEYAPKAEPVALAMYLFKFGFRTFHPPLFFCDAVLNITAVFPLFWVLGASILLSPLRAPKASSCPPWMPEKTGRASDGHWVFTEGGAQMG